jgi:hypothetical protein
VVLALQDTTFLNYYTAFGVTRDTFMAAASPACSLRRSGYCTHPMQGIPETADNNPDSMCFGQGRRQDEDAQKQSPKKPVFL